MSVVAKFKCNSVQPKWDGQEVVLTPVMSAPGEDKAFWSATPNGSLVMQVNNPDASIAFEPGKVFYLTFEEADVPVAV